MYFEHFAQHTRSQAKNKQSTTKVRKPWQKYIFYRNVMIEVIDVVLLVTLFPNLADDYKKYTKNLDELRSSITSTKPDSHRMKMIRYIGDILKQPYNPMQPEAKGPRDPPRNLKWINLILGGKVAVFPLSWFHVVYLYSLGYFRMTQGKIYSFQLPHL